MRNIVLLKRVNSGYIRRGFVMLVVIIVSILVIGFIYIKTDYMKREELLGCLRYVAIAIAILCIVVGIFYYLNKYLLNIF